jgi:hypothetical protein
MIGTDSRGQDSGRMPHSAPTLSLQKVLTVVPQEDAQATDVPFTEPTTLTGVHDLRWIWTPRRCHHQRRAV